MAKKTSGKSIDSFDDFLSALSTGNDSKGDLSVEMFKATDVNLASHVPYGIPTRIPPLDIALGRNGWPAGRVVEIYGFEHAGKSCVALAAIASVQRMGGIGIWIDAEHCFDPVWARKNGCDPEKIMVVQCDCIEAMFIAQERILETYASVAEKKPVVVVTDSLTGVPSREALEKDFGESQRLGTDARAIRVGMRKLSGAIAKSKMLFLYINHMISSTSQYQADESAGGHGIKFYASLRLRMKRTKTHMDAKNEKHYGGLQIELDLIKNKVGRTKQKKSVAQLMENGFDIYQGLLDGFLEIGVVERVNQLTYYFKPGEVQFKRSEWKALVDDQTEGADALYAWFIQKAIEGGHVQKYGL